MRNGTSFILAFIILTSVVSVSVAQVGFESVRRSPIGETTSQRKVMQFFSRSPKKEARSKKGASSLKSPVKNYHQQLFGIPAPKQSYKRTASQRTQEQPKQTSVRHASVTSKSQSIFQNTTVPEKGKLIHAEYLPQSKNSLRSIIQQTAGTDAGSNPFEPLEPFAPRNSARQNTTMRDLPVSPTPRSAVQRTTAEEEFNPFKLPPVPVAQEKPQPKPSSTLNVRKTDLPFDLDGGSRMNRFSSGVSQLETVQISVGWEKKSVINIGQECELNLIVKNESDSVTRNISVDAYFPKNVRLTKASPMPREERDHITWTISSMKPKEVKRISISLVPGKPGDLAVKAFVRLTGTSERMFAVNEPMMKLDVSGPKRVMLGDSAAHTIVVSNPGSGVTSDIHVVAALSKGLQHAKGSHVSLNIGSLNPGESRRIHLALASVGGGQQQINVIAKSGSSLTRSTSTKVMVVAPSLALNVTGPKLRYKGRNALYRVIVKNTGKVPTNNVRVMHKVPEGFQFVQADRSGKFSRQSRLVDWFIGQLDVGESTTLNVKLKATALGSAPHQISAISEEGALAKAEVKTKVDGTASLVLEIVDLDDPVEVGTETAYEVRVKNDGSKSATAVQIACVLPADVQLIGAKGPTKSFSEKNQVIFQSLQSLAPGKTALFRIHVKGKIEGNRKFRVRLNSSDMDEPLLFEESTKFYGE